jgi:nicotinamidase-related amidase
MSLMPDAHGRGRDGRALAEKEARGFVYPPSTYAAARVYNKERRYAVLVVDMLEDFIYGVLKCDRMVPKIPNVAAVLDASRAGGVPVLYCNDSHKPSDFELNRWEPHAMRGTKGAQVIRELAPKETDFVVQKSSYSSFQQTELDDVLRSLYGGKGANTLAIAGVTTDCCVRHTAADAFFRRYEVEVVEDGVEAFSDAQHEVGLQYIRYWYLCNVSPSAQLAKKLHG